MEPEVVTDSTGKWYTNALRFATKEEAEISARDLMNRWMLVRECRASESDDPVNYRMVKEGEYYVMEHVGTTMEMPKNEVSPHDGECQQENRPDTSQHE